MQGQVQSINWQSRAGQTRNELGPQLQVGPYEEMLNVSQKWVLEKALCGALPTSTVRAKANNQNAGLLPSPGERPDR